MAGKLLHGRAIHEASHAVIARKLGLAVHRIDAHPDGPHALCASAGHAAATLDAEKQIGEFEKDAIVALAGWAANRRENPHLLPQDVLAEDDSPVDDVLNARSHIIHMILLQDGKPLPAPGAAMTITPDATLRSRVTMIWLDLLRRTDALVEQHWPAIERAGRHLERHRRIDDQVGLDDLIARGERLAMLATPIGPDLA